LFLTQADRTPPPVVARLGGGLVVSVQAAQGSALRQPHTIAAIADDVLHAGAAGVRVNGTADVHQVRALTSSPIIGLDKVRGERRNLITPSVEHVIALVDAGADIVALEATTELHGRGPTPVAAARELGVAIMADVSTFDEGMRAWEDGADLVGTTLSGYTPQSGPATDEPDIELVRRLASAGVRVAAEGRYRTGEHIVAAMSAGAWTVVVGTAITDPAAITTRLLSALPGGRS